MTCKIKYLFNFFKKTLLKNSAISYTVQNHLMWVIKGKKQKKRKNFLLFRILKTISNYIFKLITTIGILEFI